jgi:hypothetical protein
MCGLERGLDYCDHGLYPDTCEECEPDEGYDDDYEDEAMYGALKST